MLEHVNSSVVVDVVTMPNYSYTFRFEDDFEHLQTRYWFANYWTLCFYCVAAYIGLVYLGQQYMAQRPKYDLRKALVCWNLSLALFSIIGTSRTLPEFIHVMTHNGLYHSVCVPSFIEHNKVSGFWTWAFVMSKVPELGDTIFIVLRKQPLIFLHWYHHATVLIYSWYAYSEYTAPARWFIVMNYMVHSAMYSYYALRALNIRIPRPVAMCITVAQLLQMVAGCYVNLWAFQMKENGRGCHVSEENIKLSLLMYFSYFILFARFFYKAYIHQGAISKAKSINIKKID